MQVQIRMVYTRCWRCNRWYGADLDSVPCGYCAQADLTEKSERIAQLRRSNAALRGALKRRSRRKP
ncbi:MAG: hypothetical protein RL685_5155 [Pseudomonadota bacterium]|jgi:hypothetical protein